MSGVAMNRLLIRNARLLDPASGLDAPGDLLVEGEQIVALGGDLSASARDAETVNADGDTHLDLLPDQAAVDVVGDLAADLEAAVHRSGMHDQRIGFGRA